MTQASEQLQPPQEQDQRPGRESEMNLLPSYVFLASDDSSYMSG